MKYLTLTLPGMKTPIDANVPVPTGGLFDTGQRTIYTFIIFFILVSVFAALYFILIAGFGLIVSRGHKENVKNNREALIYAVAGLCLVFISFLVINMLGAAVGINFFCFLFKLSCN